MIQKADGQYKNKLIEKHKTNKHKSKNGNGVTVY